MAPTVSLEQLVYATRLMNTASSHGKAAAINLRNWFVESDAKYDPQAYVLKPDVVLELAAEIIAEPTPYLRTRKAGLVTFAKLRQAGEKGELTFSKVEMRWLDRLSRKADDLPIDEDEFIQSVLPEVDRSKIRLAEYELAG
jgi:methanol--5-hydroxybenzimidazolylcobamide Co-methyltransferase